ncbi:hypothetical protein [Levilactobacillus zymae]|nr:hypothetical protein [Levilactobacillus zymae]
MEHRKKRVTDGGIAVSHPFLQGWGNKGGLRNVVRADDVELGG